MGFTVTLEGLYELDAAWSDAMAELGAGMRRAVILAAREGAEEGRATATWKDRTGEARRTITSQLVADTFGKVEADILAPLDRHVWLDQGTSPHEIRPKVPYGFVGPTRRSQGRRAITDVGTHRVALRWYVGDVPVFARVVRHPGTKGDGFAGRMYLKAERVLQAELELAIARIAAKFGG